jgi:hypothetical protein
MAQCFSPRKLETETSVLVAVGFDRILNSGQPNLFPQRSVFVSIT